MLVKLLRNLLSLFSQENKSEPINSRGILLTEEFKEALNLLNNTSQNLFITGKAGTGKSTLIDYFRHHTHKKVVVLAPTGIAALNIRGQTIHSFFQFPPRLIHKSSLKKLTNDRIYKDVDRIVIDEISMVRADLLDGIDHFMRMHGRDKNLPFGGAQMVFIGDLYQLPPILRDEDKQVYKRLYDTPYFFGAEAFKSIPFKLIELTKIFRQSDDEFIEILNSIRIGEIKTNTLESINKRVVKDISSLPKDSITLATTNKVANGINESELNKINNPMFIYHATIKGDFPVDQEGNSLPVDLELKLKKGARVMFVKNDKGRRWVNGTIGIVEELGKEWIKVKLNEPSFKGIVDVPLEKWERIKYSYDEDKNEIIPTVLGELIQYPFKLAWAITIHKSQGMTFNRVTVNYARSPFAHGQTYVALSRCRTLEGLTLTKSIYPNDVIVDREIVEFIKAYPLD